MRLIFLFLFLFIQPFVWAMSHLSPQESSLIGKAAPDAVLINTDGRSSSVIGSRQGKKAILIFWATWCPHCYEELGTINADWASMQQKGIKIILVDAGETVKDAKEYFNQRQMKLDSFVDENGSLQDAYHLIGVPTLVFIDEKGIIRNMTYALPSDYQDYFRDK